MRPLLQHVSHSRSFFEQVAAVAFPAIGRSCQNPLVPLARKPACLQCQFRASSWPSNAHLFPLRAASWNSHSTRSFSSSVPSRNEHPSSPPLPPVSETSATTATHNTLGAPSESPSPKSPVDTVKRVPDEDLPSHRERQRWDLSKRFSRIMDDLQANLAVASHKLNRYTGTDYSGIEALRSEIKEQEQLVKARHAAVKEAKNAYDAAHAQQAASSKEVVGLLERKHSWAAADLERYMSLIRSEHVNDQAVQIAKDNLSAAERALEEARSRLEKRERAQYHEEQIWSDTIRRNSTWVTFGLMGVNIFLLLASLVVIEPWRRRRLVKEFRRALEEKSATSAAAPAMLALPAVEKEVESVVEPHGVALETLERAAPEEVLASPQPGHVAIDPLIGTTASKQGTEDVVAGEGTAQQAVQEETLSSTIADPTPEPARDMPIQFHETRASWSVFLDQARAYLQDLFSERAVAVRKVDLTTIALEGAAAGVAFMGLIFVLLRPR